jgi:hypothetical protein
VQAGKVGIPTEITKSPSLTVTNSNYVIMNKPRPKLKIRDGRKSYLQTRARELASSGRFERWQSIEFELKFVEGLPEAHVLLADRRMRKRLDLLCQQARSSGPVPDET